MEAEYIKQEPFMYAFFLFISIAPCRKIGNYPICV
jgi:hypothetical protein